MFIFGGPNEESIRIKPNESHKNIDKKIKEIENFLENPTSLPQKIRESHGSYHHEIMFDQPIELDNNLLAIVCSHCDMDDRLNKIKKIIKNKSYKNVTILVSPLSLSKLKHLQKWNPKTSLFAFYLSKN